MLLTDGKRTIGRVIPACFPLSLNTLQSVCAHTDTHRPQLYSRPALVNVPHPTVGMEKKKLPELSVQSCAGLKVVVQDFQIRCGIAFLRPENCCVLGGSPSFHFSVFALIISSVVFTCFTFSEHPGNLSTIPPSLHLFCQHGGRAREKKAQEDRQRREIAQAHANCCRCRPG